MASSMYETSQQEIWDLYADYCSGSRSASVLVLSSSPLEATPCHALESSFARLGYGSGAITYVCAESPANPQVKLDATSIFAITEGLDPFCIVVTDYDAATLLAKAYRAKVAVDSTERVFGRPAAVFSSFADMLTTDEGKQSAWALLKRLPQR